MRLLAQADLGALPDSDLKYAVIFFTAVIIVTAFVTSAVFSGLQYVLDKKNARAAMKREIHPQPLLTQDVDAPANVGEIEARHEEINRRLYHLDGPEGQINQLWATLRNEDDKIKSDVNEKFLAIQRALGRIEGKLDK